MPATLSANSLKDSIFFDSLPSQLSSSSMTLCCSVTLKSSSNFGFSFSSSFGAALPSAGVVPLVVVEAPNVNLGPSVVDGLVDDCASLDLLSACESLVAEEPKSPPVVEGAVVLDVPLVVLAPKRFELGVVPVVELPVADVVEVVIVPAVPDVVLVVVSVVLPNILVVLVVAGVACVELVVVLPNKFGAVDPRLFDAPDSPVVVEVAAPNVVVVPDVVVDPEAPNSDEVPVVPGVVEDADVPKIDDVPVVAGVVDVPELPKIDDVPVVPCVVEDPELPKRDDVPVVPLVFVVPNNPAPCVPVVPEVGLVPDVVAAGVEDVPKMFVVDVLGVAAAPLVPEEPNNDVPEVVELLADCPKMLFVVVDPDAG
ncbi:C immunoglobulin-A-binding beta antigen, putative [Babesia ovata]|uniref:C immunoglobulin-A-binding beta antigen, putative n=1 Tax=Babesia ovata TaxID=189622 RepID=A0A2H6K7K3_9APIC|nr:C immunoglobulin-A-binding beta antigen, putative [Babesia ovata]GBE58982.1 C immunoglobulin-A-binding beta antigen, putative [Babesia ovata]